MEDRHYRRYFHSSSASSVHNSSRLISRPFFQLPSSFFHSVFFSRTVHQYALTDSTAPLVPSLRYHLPFLRSCPPPYPSDSFQPSRILATMYYARTNRVAHVGPSWESVRPSPRAPPSRRGLLRRSTSRCSLSLSDISQAQFSPGDHPVRRWFGTTLNPGSRWHVGSPRSECKTRALETRCFSPCFFVPQNLPPLFRPDLLLFCGLLRLARFNADENVCPAVSAASVVCFRWSNPIAWRSWKEKKNGCGKCDCIFWK